MNGEAYVSVRASRAGGANGNGSEGFATSGNYWIHWNNNGFTGKGWKYIESELRWTGFPAIADRLEYEISVEGLEAYMKSSDFPGNLDDVLGDGNWALGSKTTFVTNNVDVLGIYGNIGENDPWYVYCQDDGCIEAL